mmetsp:Transcript_27089/g.65853  ORF Transcript_27089/g.65853 Transcript_27089/m.65853 type:complete len:152 (-) Transcript_27089:154-609(-)
MYRIFDFSVIFAALLSFGVLVFGTNFKSKKDAEDESFQYIRRTLALQLLEQFCARVVTLICAWWLRRHSKRSNLRKILNKFYGWGNSLDQSDMENKVQAHFSLSKEPDLRRESMESAGSLFEDTSLRPIDCKESAVSIMKAVDGKETDDDS